MNIPQLKICGLTSPEQALFCANAGADAIGVVFFSKSPRNVCERTARKISDTIKGKAICIGVFVDETFDSILQKVRNCRLGMVQLHGNESPELVSKLKLHGVQTVKCLYLENQPDINRAADYPCDAFLLECRKGKLPGGNAVSWDFKKADQFIRCSDKPVMIAGGLTPDNIVAAVKTCRPDGIDLSSGVEKEKRLKDISKVKTIIENLKKQCKYSGIRRIF